MTMAPEASGFARSLRCCARSARKRAASAVGSTFDRIPRRTARPSRMQGPDGLYPGRPGSDPYFVPHQMIAVLVELARARLVPEAAAFHRERALATWRATETAWSSSARYYSVAIGTPSVCVHLE